MNEQDIFVGIVSLGLGLFVVGSAVFNTPGFTRFWMCRRMENAFGPDVTRLVGGLIGLLVATLGVLLMLGFLSAKKSRSGRSMDNFPMETGYVPVVSSAQNA